MKNIKYCFINRKYELGKKNHSKRQQKNGKIDSFSHRERKKTRQRMRKTEKMNIGENREMTERSIR